MTLRPLTLIGIILSIITGVCLGVLDHVHWQKQQSPDHANVSNTLSQALSEVSTHYVEEISEQQLLGYAIDGMMRGLDEHSNYLDPQSFESLQATTSGRFGGIGIELGLVNGYFTVIAPMDDTPAQRAGLLAGDRIVGVNGDSAKGMQLSTLIERLRGEPGSPVTLSIHREGAEDTDYAIERAIIRVASVKSRMLAPGYGYLRISQFQTSTGRDVKSQLQALQQQAGGKLAGLVLDLRNNPGGTLQSSVEVADHFLHRGVIVSTAGRQPSSEARYNATSGDLLEGSPIVVLINRGSASASEIVAASLRDHQRARLMGDTSYGKGSVQSVLPLDNQQAIKLTTAYYYTPNGRTIHEQGIDPDIPFSGDEEALLDEAVQELTRQAGEQLQARLEISSPND